MIKEFCDRCGAETTDQTSGSIHGVADADRDGNGETTHCFEILCASCYTAVIAFIKLPATATGDPPPVGEAAADELSGDAAAAAIAKRLAQS